ncbi:response regulator receiver domain protein [Ostertagia ostertagi]
MQNICLLVDLNGSYGNISHLCIPGGPGIGPVPMIKPPAKKITIYLSLEKEILCGYFNKQDPAPLYKRQLSQELEQYIMTSIRSAKKESEFNYKITYSNEEDKDYAEPLLYAIRRHFADSKSLAIEGFDKFKLRSYKLLFASLAFESADRPAAMFATDYPLRILIAEDNVINQKIATKILSSLGYETSLANNGKEVVEMAGNESYDLILMDVQMPEMNGLEATRMLRICLPVQPVIIALTANAMQGDRDECMQAGMDDYMSKPIEIDELMRQLQKWYRARKASNDSAL